MEFVKFSRSELPTIRKKLMVIQKGICPICGKDLTRTKPVNIVIDHDHKTGIVRAALHRGCNKVEGSILATLTRWGKAKGIYEVIATLERLISFWKLHLEPQTEWIYYNHKTAAEKRVAYNAKRRRRRNAKNKND